MEKYFKNILNAEELSELDMENIKGGLTCAEFTCAKFEDCKAFACGIFKDTGIQIDPVTPGN